MTGTFHELRWLRACLESKSANAAGGRVLTVDQLLTFLIDLPDEDEDRSAAGSTPARRTKGWWCALDREFINLDNYEALGDRPPCGPDLQCTGGRRGGLPCGWYYLIRFDEVLDAEG
jgi:hypothetical protein